MTTSRRVGLGAIPIAVLLAAILASCRGTESVDSGVEGTVRIGPMCPVVQAGSECPDAPLAAALLVEDEDGRTVARSESSADGSFRIPLPPGRYRLVPQPGENRMPWASPLEFTVAAGERVRLDVQYDSGIR